jgi:hypothetical protein
LNAERPAMMRPPLQKQVYELAVNDLERFPIWEFSVDPEARGGQNESTIRPYLEAGPLNSAERMFVVRATFTLVDGVKLKGYLTPPARGREGFSTMQPVIVTERGQVRFWCGTTAPDAKRLAQNYAYLGRDARHVFPMRFESDVELIGEPARGTIPGFLVLEDFQTRSTRTVI